jgi:hypothetical protein
MIMSSLCIVCWCFKGMAFKSSLTIPSGPGALLFVSDFRHSWKLHESRIELCSQVRLCWCLSSTLVTGVSGCIGHSTGYTRPRVVTGSIEICRQILLVKKFSTMLVTLLGSVCTV